MRVAIFADRVAGALLTELKSAIEKALEGQR
jgi:hypothetical protein